MQAIHTQGTRRGFTFIELWVVVAVVGVLASLILAGLAQRQNRADRAVDINNLGRIITALQTYSNEHDGCLPWSNWSSACKTGWLYSLSETANPADVHSQFVLQGGLLWPLLKDPKVYMCPMDNPHNTNRLVMFTSYTMNAAVSGYQRAIVSSLRLSVMRTDDVVFWETDERYRHSFAKGANTPDERMTARHDNGGVVATFGGSVEYWTLDYWHQLAEANPEARNRLWCYPKSSDGH
jgi:prepilin-type N-terminal cleavage/methylation domain-containing protein